MEREEQGRVLEMYFTQHMEMEEIAKALGAPLAEVAAALNDPKLLLPYVECAQAAKLRAQICVNQQAEEAARKQAELIALGEGAKEHAVSQRAAKDILDRAGISVEADMGRELRIVFVGMPELGMPETGEETEDGNRA